ncbi:hypothetical protein [Streptomyces pakalii]|uniref:DUF5602 domain-containing protein n=1 Tax=Streptomyces pakalii TaxID=3036494 RepID=A0ABT7D015_9ACTN|nr:hypothetical protein [Streptomyces pakalii]MDJ1639133.1 hypothetical protein [Streptomyces pakalii]
MIRNALRMRWSLPLALALLVVASFTPMLIAAGSKASASAPSLSRAAGAGGAALPKLTSFNKVSLGDGTVETLYAADSAKRPVALAVRVDAAAMKTLPSTPTHDGQTCFDTGGDGIDLEADCASGHERALWFPKLNGLPFQWLMFNWQKNGHGPTHVFDKPHFDMHFFIQDFSARNQIRTGPCNLVINCDDDATAKKPVPAPYAPVGWGLPGAAGRMGNHIIDPEAAPANGGAFTQAFAYGTWNGHISFWEPVVNRDWVVSQKPASACQPIPQTPQVELTGYYPETMCTRYGSGGEMTFTFEKFVKRTAPAGAKAPVWTSKSPAGGAVKHQH